MLFFSGCSDVYAVSRKKLNERIERANNYLEDVMEILDTRIPSALLRKSHGVVIIRQYKAGFIFGVKGGKGVALKRDKKNQKVKRSLVCYQRGGKCWILGWTTIS